MKEHRCDILVIGAGPAGSSAAWNASSLGLKVLLVDGKKFIGKPVRCAEYIPKQLFGELDIKKDFIVQPIYNMKTFMPDGEIIETPSPGYIINREKFDQVLLKRAKKAGTEVWAGCRALLKDRDYVTVRKNGEYIKIYSKIIIGADGPRSKVGKWIGSVNRNLIPAIQARVSLTSPLNDTEVYFHKDFYGGYGWLFPKDNKGNLGLGMKPEPGYPTIKESLNRLIKMLQVAGRIKGDSESFTAGWIPAESPRNITAENIILAGDAAGQSHPLTGAGIAQAVICGNMAGKWAARAVRKNNIGLISEYENEWYDLYGESQKRAFRRRELLEGKWDDLDNVIKKCWVSFKEYYKD
ncbi:geranylgeranyl reductase family protein [Thermodesulfobacteriota bacterium]